MSETYTRKSVTYVSLLKVRPQYAFFAVVAVIEIGKRVEQREGTTSNVAHAVESEGMRQGS